MDKDEIAYDRKVVSGIIHKNPCHLWGFIINSKDDKKGYADIYDGENATQGKVMRVRALLGDSKVILFPKPILMRRALYVSMNVDGEEYTVFWKPIAD